MALQEILTQRGIIPAADVNIGDFLYEYETSNRLEIKHIEKITTAIYDIKYTDKRVEKINEKGLIYCNNQKHRVDEVSCKEFPFTQPLQLYPVNFNKYNVTKPLDPDPYVAGALFSYGDYEDEFINLPIIKESVVDALCNKYAMEIMSIDGVYHFKYKHEDEFVRWKDFFSRYAFYAKNKNPNEPLIPTEYMYTSIKDNLEFIKGVFDTGYSKQDSPDIVSIKMKDRKRLEIIQRILWSLGIPSYIGNDKGINKLDIIGKMESYPGFFYSEDTIAHFINADADSYKTNPTFYVMVESVTPSLLHIHDDWYEFYTDKKHAVYMSSNFLPIITA